MKIQENKLKGMSLLDNDFVVINYEKSMGSCQGGDLYNNIYLNYERKEYFHRGNYSFRPSEKDIIETCKKVGIEFNPKDWTFSNFALKMFPKFQERVCLQNRWTTNAEGDSYTNWDYQCIESFRCFFNKI